MARRSGLSVGYWRARSQSSCRAARARSLRPYRGQRDAGRSTADRRTPTTWPRRARSGGNPFLVEELSRAKADPATPDEPLPAGLRTSWLGSDSATRPRRSSRRSAAGRVVDDDLLAKVVELPERDLVRGCMRRSTRASWCTSRAPASTATGSDIHCCARSWPGGCCRSRRDDCMARSPRPDRGWRTSSSAAEVAFHWDAAGDAGRPRASVEAAAAAEAVYAFADARGHYERALRLRSWRPTPTTGSIDRLGIIDRAAAMAALVGEPQRAIALARRRWWRSIRRSIPSERRSSAFCIGIFRTPAIRGAHQGRARGGAADADRAPDHPAPTSAPMPWTAPLRWPPGLGRGTGERGPGHGQTVGGRAECTLGQLARNCREVDGDERGSRFTGLAMNQSREQFLAAVKRTMRLLEPDEQGGTPAKSPLAAGVPVR